LAGQTSLLYYLDHFPQIFVQYYDSPRGVTDFISHFDPNLRVSGIIDFVRRNLPETESAQALEARLGPISRLLQRPEMLQIIGADGVREILEVLPVLREIYSRSGINIESILAGHAN